MRVLVTRTGSPLWWSSIDNPSVSASGEGDTFPCIDYLSTAGHEVAYFGQVRNYDPTSPVECFSVDLKGIDENDPPAKVEAEVIERCDPAIDRVIEWAPDCVIEYCGENFTHYSPLNARAAGILGVCWRFGFPTGYMYHRTKLKRNLVITDPPLYPRHSEMFNKWPECLPNAVLSQEQITWDRVIQALNVRITTRYSGCENWITHRMTHRESTRQRPCVIASHAHHRRQGQNTGQRMELWKGILSGCPNGTGVCGRGWDELGVPPHCEYVGVLKTFQDAMNFINTGLGGPIVPQKLGFATSKARFYALNGAVPYLFDRDPAYRYCYDSPARVLPLAHPARWDWQDPTCLDLTDEQRAETVAMILDATKPCWDDLHELIERRGDNRDGKFGRYEVLS